MPDDGLKTSHDLADILEEVARILRRFPPVSVANDERFDVSHKNQGKRRTNEAPEHAGHEFESLAEEISGLDRSSAEVRLGSLTIDTMRQLANTMGIRTPSKALKREYVSLLIMQLFRCAGRSRVDKNVPRKERSNPSPEFLGPRIGCDRGTCRGRRIVARVGGAVSGCRAGIPCPPPEGGGENWGILRSHRIACSAAAPLHFVEGAFPLRQRSCCLPSRERGCCTRRRPLGSRLRGFCRAVHPHPNPLPSRERGCC